MRTKHLFYTAAMAALFAACVNDDFETIGQQGNVANDGRPVVGNVKLNFIEAGGADTRLSYDSQQGGYQWEATDEIGALLMDNVKAHEGTWLEKYSLISDIHTSFRFTYDTEEKVWGCDTKMLEGNYFFAYPWEDYDGRREVAHSLMNQTQEGIGAEVRAESYADNQFFIGYSRIKAGTTDKETLNDVKMVSLLGAIQLQIKNTGTVAKHINKVVLSGNKNISSVMTFDPTDAAYVNPDDANKNWNLVNTKLPTAWGASTEAYFNYANYEGDEAEVEKYRTDGTEPVYNIESGDEYSYIEALRSVAKAHTELNKEKSVQITITGENRTLEPGGKNTAYVLIMCNPLTKEQIGNDLKLSIYTDEGVVSNIDLTNIHAESDDYTVVTNKAIEAIGPDVPNTVQIEIDNNSFVVPKTMEIFNSNDLEQFIKWNTTVAGVRNNIAILQQDVTFTPEMLAALKANKNTSISIVSPDEVDVKDRAILTLDKNLPANVLDEKQLSFSATNYRATPIVVEGEVALTKESAKVASIEVAEGATLAINDKDAVVPNMQPGESADYYDIVNNGSLNIGADAVVAEDVHVQNNATMTVAADGDCKASVVNTKDAVIKNNGYMLNVTNQADATIELGANAILRQSTNEGLIKTATGAQVSVTGSAAGEIEYVSGVKTIVADNNTVSTRVAGTTITKTTFDATKIGCTISKLIVGEGITTLADATDTAYEYSFKEVVLENNAELVVGSTHKLSVTNMTVEGDATVNGNITATNVTVEEEGTLVNNGVMTTTIFENNGAVENNNVIMVDKYDGKGSWKYNPMNESKTAFKTALKEAVKVFINEADTYKNGGYTVTLKGFTTVLSGKWAEGKPAMVTLNSTYADDVKALTQSDLDEAVKTLQSENKTALITLLGKATVATDNILYDTKDAANATTGVTSAYSVFRDNVLKRNTTAISAGIADADLVVLNAANALEAADIDDALAKAGEGEAYIWAETTCPLYDVMAVALSESIADWNAALELRDTDELSEITDLNTLKKWISAVRTTNNTASILTPAKTVVEKYGSKYNSWNYEAAQFNAVKTELEK